MEKNTIKSNNFYIILKEIISKNTTYNWKVLDVGCGRGNILIDLSKQIKEGIGIDIKEKALQQAKTKTRDHKITNVHFIKAPAEKLPFQENKFNLVITTSALEHMQNPEKSILEMIRVLKQEGLLIINVPNYIWIYEPHYKIPMLPLMPKSIMRNWARLFKKDANYIDSIFYTTIPFFKKILKKTKMDYRNFSLVLLEKYIKQPEHYLEHWPKIQKFIFLIRKIKAQRLCYFLASHFHFYPSIILVIKKPLKTI